MCVRRHCGLLLGRRAVASAAAPAAARCCRAGIDHELPPAARRYVTTPSLFLFDLATSVPFSYYDLIVYEVRE